MGATNNSLDLIIVEFSTAQTECRVQLSKKQANRTNKQTKPLLFGRTLGKENKMLTFSQKGISRRN